ncbi:hypothetical protein M9H77_07101 [Catharanthus roseus]|uniref:Uncharacterized protein n=1 Tax=Catharanthus roseus TaxID=4058 RepID=A0ACC0BU82_CATRO|nr:hypothetical protein M9H77_07101 [Catharanthus roseus]
MEEVPAHVYPGPIIPDVLTRQHKHRYKVKNEPLEAWILREFTRSENDDDLILHSCGFILLLLGGYMFPDLSGSLFVWLSYHDRGLVLSDLWRAEVPLICYEIVEYHHPVREVNDMATGVIQGLLSSPTQIASFTKKVQTIIHRCIPLRCRPQEPVPDRGARGVKMGARKLPSGRARRRSYDHCEPFDSPNLDMPTFSLALTPLAQSHPSGLGTSYAPPPPSIVGSSIQAPLSLGFGFSSFQAPPPPGTAGSSTPHMLISYASSSDSDEHDDEFGHHVGKKTTRFTPSD